jgi:hypothetical protein
MLDRVRLAWTGLDFWGQSWIFDFGCISDEKS